MAQERYKLIGSAVTYNRQSRRHLEAVGKLEQEDGRPLADAVLQLAWPRVAKSLMQIRDYLAVHSVWQQNLGHRCCGQV